MADHSSAAMHVVRDGDDQVVDWVAECSGGEVLHGESLAEVDAAWCAHVNEVLPDANEVPVSRKYTERSRPKA